MVKKVSNLITPLRADEMVLTQRQAQALALVLQKGRACTFCSRWKLQTLCKSLLASLGSRLHTNSPAKRPSRLLGVWLVLVLATGIGLGWLARLLQALWTG